MNDLADDYIEHSPAEARGKEISFEALENFRLWKEKLWNPGDIFAVNPSNSCK